MKIYHNPRCRKSRETLGIINEKGEQVEIIEYLTTPPSKEELADIVSMLGIKPVELIRRGEEIFKTHFKGKDLTDDQWIEAMVEHPKLIERPIVVKGKKAVIGRPPEKVLEIL